MRRKSKAIVSGAAAAAGCLALGGCGSGDNGSASATPPATSMPTEQLDTAAVLSIVQTRTSETTTPFMVDGGAVAVTPADDDTSLPIPVNGA
jgi:hypothetical protein